MTKTKSLLMVFVLMPFIALAASLTIGNETFKPSDKSGYVYSFSSCAATASYNESSGFKLSFGGDSSIGGWIHASNADLELNVNGGVNVVVTPKSTGDRRAIDASGSLTINGPGKLTIINGRINNYDLKIFAVVLNITCPDRYAAIWAEDSLEVNASFVTIVGTGTLVGGNRMLFTASMLNLYAGEKSSSGTWEGAIAAGSRVSMTGCVASIIEKDYGADGILSRGEMLIGDSCIVVVSTGTCFYAPYYYTGKENNNVSFQNVRVFAVSQNANPVCTDHYRSLNNGAAFFGEGKYVLCSADGCDGVVSGKVVIDGGELEVCSPNSCGVNVKDFEMKDGSLNMVDAVSYKQVLHEIMSESAVMGALAGMSGGKWTALHTEIFANMLLKLDAVILSDPRGKAEAMISSRFFLQTGGCMVQGNASHGYLAIDYLLGTSVKPRLTPAFIGDSFNGDFGYYYGDYYDMAPTNAFGQTLTHVSYAPYWVYTGTGEELVVPTGYYRICFVAESGGEPVSLLCQPGHVYRLPTYTATPPAGKKFVGWRCLRTGKRYDDQLLVFNLGQSCETVTMMAIWE